MQSFEQCFILFSSFPLLLAFDVGGLGFEFCVFVAGWRHALRSEWPFLTGIILLLQLSYIGIPIYNILWNCNRAPLLIKYNIMPCGKKIIKLGAAEGYSAAFLFMMYYLLRFIAQGGYFFSHRRVINVINDQLHFRSTVYNFV